MSSTGVEAGADYLLTLKSNREAMYESVRGAFAQQRAEQSATVRVVQNLATLRGLALMLLERDTSSKAGVARKRGRVARKAACREHVLPLVFQGDWMRSPCGRESPGF